MQKRILVVLQPAWAIESRIWAPIYLFVGLLVILQVEPRVPASQSKLYPSPKNPFLIHTPFPLVILLPHCLLTLPSLLCVLPPFLVSTPISRVFLMFLPMFFPVFFQLTLCLPSYRSFIVSPQWGTHHYHFPNLHAFPLLLESQGIIMHFDDSLETCIRSRITFGSESPKGTNSARLPT